MDSTEQSLQNPLITELSDEESTRLLASPRTVFVRTFSLLIFAICATYGVLAWGAPSEATTEARAQGAAAAAVDTTAFESLSLEANSAFVLDLSSGTVLFKKNADIQLPLASITKVALVLAVLEVVTPDRLITISEDAVTRGEGGLVAGDVWRAEDLMKYTLVTSSNVGAEALAEAAEGALHTRYPDAPREDAVVMKMNSLAQKLGLTKTYFLNPSGLDLSPTQPSAMGSARDVSILLAYAYRTYPSLFASTADVSLSIGPVNGPLINAENTNDAIFGLRNLRMGKTGFTDLAGGNLGIVFEPKTSHVVVAVVLGSSQNGRFIDMLAISQAAAQ